MWQINKKKGLEKVPKAVIRRDQIKDTYSVNQDNTSMMIRFTFNMCPRTGKESCRFFGSPPEFTDLMEYALKLEGSLSQTKDPENHKIFKADNAEISWWNSTKTLSISEKRENKIRKQLKAFVQKRKSAVDRTYNISQEDISSDSAPPSINLQLLTHTTAMDTNKSSEIYGQHCIPYLLIMLTQDLTSLV